ncbi:UDP-N-acetylglucosamine 2-epimerase [Ensifer sp. NPDC090286]|uniref:UDP-N-acetylglucosamine 2-epimerase n=1 Tax=Ensifer sp. NPDC090286 TaxID=3363991 RepID=UPI00383A1958
MSVKKVLAITGARSEYGLMSPLFELLRTDPEMELKLLVTGAHLSPLYGHSARQIEQDGFDILLRIESLLDADSRASRIKTASIFLQGAIDTVANYNPDLIIYAGDREEVIMGALIGGYLGVPTLHFYGGDHVQDSHIDNPVRHATSKLSTGHMVTLDQHRQRLIRMGEPAERIHVVGNIALDRFVQNQPDSPEKVCEDMGVGKDFAPFAMMIFHPVGEEEDVADVYFECILKALQTRGIKTFVGYPNSDPGNRRIISMIDKYRNDINFHFYRNLDAHAFLSIYKNARFIIGNSSSGVIESASVPIPAINVGLRQTSRVAGENVIFCKPEAQAISDAIDLATSDAFRARISGIRNPYGDGDSARKALNIIKRTDWRAMLAKNEDAIIAGAIE